MIASFDFILQYYSAYYPPSWWSFIVIAVFFIGAGILLYKYIKEPFPTYILTIISFLPLILITLFIFAVVGIAGSAGFTGPVPDTEPYIVARRTLYSLIAGSALTLTMLFTVGGISLFKTLRNHKNKK